MSFETTAKNIISESIKSAVFIDDAIPELDNTDFCTHPYTVPLYRSFKASDCSLDFHKFTGIESLNDKLLFERKDLIILDWELDSVDPKFKSTLEIIDKAVDTDNLHFVCIYSHRGDDYQDIFIKILAYYSGNKKNQTDNNIQQITDFLEEDGADPDDILNKLTILIKELIFNTKTIKDFRTECREIFNARWDDFKNLITSIYPSNNDRDSFMRYGFDLLKSEIYHDKEKDVYIHNKKNYLQINNTFFAVFKKNDTIPNNLYEDFSKAISSANEAFLTFLSLEMRNKLMSKSALIGKNLSKINESAFIHHKNTLNPDYAFDQYLIELWANYNTAWLYKEKSKVLSVIEDYMEKKGDITDPNDYDLSMLNYFYNIDHTIVSINRSISFGDIFYSNESKNEYHYLLCVTPHCDCLNPKKINGFYYFVRGKSIKINKGLKSGDSGFISFIKDTDDKTICIEWLPKPFTLFIPEENRDISNLIPVTYADYELELSYQCALKENYCQRISNQSFSYSNRIGISFVKTKNEDTCKNFIHNTCKHIQEMNPEAAKE